MSDTAKIKNDQTTSDDTAFGDKEVKDEISTSNTSDGTVRSVRRALDILNLFTEENLILTVRDTTNSTGLPKTTVLRLLQTLEHAGLLWSLETGGYTPGPALLHWARIANESWQLPPDFREVLAELSEVARETVNVYVRKGLRRVCIAQVPGPQSLRHVVRVGDELPLWAGASAKILLAQAPKSTLEAVAQESPSNAAKLETLNLWCEQVRERGWATSHAERDDGVSAVAVPIKSRDGRVVAALAISGPSSRFAEEKVEFFIAELNKATDELRRRASEGRIVGTSLFPQPRKGETA
ncbi:IclR family transcriptional regulator [Acidithrix ferrooxidans]|uniref:HTH-type transcriptional regulator KipR n=1 Tax=Acidithrix ferrooxidans TaxID=1280514 RepID=A0A0D8HHG7_9ACTN|nr:IclR family transcriptional regulator [Acidithrix ferrooxidans]KJF17425.1 HTH-type transcriptional regulator KipR [Acidithrix ferrooxidans]